jgi:hypothetical protein
VDCLSFFFFFWVMIIILMVVIFFMHVIVPTTNVIAQIININMFSQGCIWILIELGTSSTINDMVSHFKVHSHSVLGTLVLSPFSPY